MSSAVVRAGEGPGRGSSVGQEASLLVDVKGAGREAVTGHRGCSLSRARRSGCLGFVLELLVPRKKIHPRRKCSVSYKFGIGPRGKDRDVYSRGDDHSGEKLKLPLWTKARCGGRRGRRARRSPSHESLGEILGREISGQSSCLVLFLLVCVAESLSKRIMPI